MAAVAAPVLIPTTICALGGFYGAYDISSVRGLITLSGKCCFPLKCCFTALPRRQKLSSFVLRPTGKNPTSSNLGLACGLFSGVGLVVVREVSNSAPQ